MVQGRRECGGVGNGGWADAERVERRASGEVRIRMQGASQGHVRRRGVRRVTSR